MPFSQYAKIETDFRYYLKLGNRGTLASRAIAGFGLPYANSSQLPFIKQFFIGGANSLRGFRARSIGTGKYKQVTNNANSFLPDQSGDIKLEFNSEYKADFTSIFKGAFFVDSGNIWLLNADAQKPGTSFSKEFVSELAMDAGAGARIDVAFLILRVVIAFPIRNPYLPKGDAG